MVTVGHFIVQNSRSVNHAGLSNYIIPRWWIFDAAGIFIGTKFLIYLPTSMLRISLATA